MSDAGPSFFCTISLIEIRRQLQTSFSPTTIRKWFIFVAAVRVTTAFIQFRSFVAVKYGCAAVQVDCLTSFSLRFPNFFDEVFNFQYKVFSIRYFVPPTPLVPYQETTGFADLLDDIEDHLPSLQLDLFVTLGARLFLVHFLNEGSDPRVSRIPDQRYTLPEQDIVQLRALDDISKIVR